MAGLGGLEIVSRRLPDDPKITPLLTNAIHAAERGKSLVQRMLTFARRQVLKPEPIELPALLAGIIDPLRRSLGLFIRIETQCLDAVSAVLADRHQLELAILNLATNARDAMPDGGTIVIAAREELAQRVRSGQEGAARFICLSVMDNGEGMSDSTLARGMEPFFTTKGVGKGTGLGLSTLHGLAEQSGGRLILKSKPGDGTVAELWLPSAEPLAVADLNAPVQTWDQPVSSMATSATPTAATPPVVLAADADKRNLMKISRTLNDLRHRVFSEYSAVQVLDLLRQETEIDVLLIDSDMPGVDRSSFVEAAKAIRPDMGVILMTPPADPSVIMIANPLDPTALAAGLRRLQPKPLQPAA